MAPRYATLRWQVEDTEETLSHPLSETNEKVAQLARLHRVVRRREGTRPHAAGAGKKEAKGRGTKGSPAKVT